MASSPLAFSSASLLQHPDPRSSIRPIVSSRNPRRFERRRNRGAPVKASAGPTPKPTKLVTFLGKGGSGKTTAAVLAAQYYANEGLRTCLVIHSQDPTAEHLIGCKIGTSPSVCKQNLSAMRVETTKMLLEPLDRIKKADSDLSLTQGILEGVVGEELGVLAGMDSIFSALALEKFTNFLGEIRNKSQKFDVIVYDGISTEETLRIIASAEKARWYLKHIRNLTEKTDIGRLAAPSGLKLVYESAISSRGSGEGKTTAEIWNGVEHLLERSSASFTDSSKFRCYLVIDPSRPLSVSSALRYWGCAIQAGTEIAGAFASTSNSSFLLADVAEKMLPLPFACMPCIATDMVPDWDATLDTLGSDAKNILNTSTSTFGSLVQFDHDKKTVTLFMPGFHKSEIKLYQYRGGAELLVEAGDQRRVIRLPTVMQGKVTAAKFIDRSLIVTLK